MNAIPTVSAEDLAFYRLASYAAYQWPSYQLAKHHLLIARHLEAVERGEITRLMITMPPRHGKQCSHDTPVFTPNGWMTHGDLKVGDFVYHPSGRPIQVLAIGQEAEQDYTLETFDGAKIECHANHEWTVYDRSRSGWRTVSTEYLASQRFDSGGRARFQLPEVSALEGSDTLLGIDPYFFGAWLGDGKSSGSTICGTPADMAEIEAMIPYEKGSEWVQENTGVAYRYFKGGALSSLRGLGVINNKHIPEQFFTASEVQRRSLLAGLVDTDGSLEAQTGRVRFRSGSERLANDVAFLARTLGYRVSVDKTERDERDRHIKGGESWCVQWTPHDGLGAGAISRKVSFRKRSRRRIGIKSVFKSQTKMGRCIQVDAHDGLYLVGRHLTPTHNSMLASEFFPAWYLGRNPDHYVVAATYAQELADDFGRKVRNQIADPSYSAIFPGVGLKSDSTSSRRFHVTQPADSFSTGQNGAYFAVGVGGPLTGRGAHLLLIDDPVKNREEAESEIIRKKTKDWYTSTAYTRLMPGGRVVIIQTRWHEDDLSGWLQAEHADEGWVVLNLPAINDAGEALWPDQYGVEDLLRIKRALPPRDWSALYQQAPSPETGDYFKKEWIHEVDHTPPLSTLRIYGGSDYAVTQSGGDYTVHAVVGVDPQSRLYLLDLWRAQASSDKWVEAFCDLVKKWKPIGWAEETGQIKSGVGPFLIRTMLEKGAYVAREQFPTRGDKAIRAQSFRGRIAATGLHIPKDAEWKSDLISEMMSFPVGVHDDQVDALGLVGQLLDRMMAGEPEKITPIDAPPDDGYTYVKAPPLRRGKR